MAGRHKRRQTIYRDGWFSESFQQFLCFGELFHQVLRSAGKHAEHNVEPLDKLDRKTVDMSTRLSNLKVVPKEVGLLVVRCGEPDIKVAYSPAGTTLTFNMPAPLRDRKISQSVLIIIGTEPCAPIYQSLTAQLISQVGSHGRVSRVRTLTKPEAMVGLIKSR